MQVTRWVVVTKKENKTAQVSPRKEDREPYQYAVTQTNKIGKTIELIL